MTGAGGEQREWRLRAAGVAAGACFAAALAGFGAALDGYAHGAWPVALLGASGVPRATAFNLLAFVVPGLLAAFVALRRRDRLPPGAGLGARLGWTLALLAAAAFAAQGLLPLDARAPDAGQGRLHGVAWGLWGSGSRPPRPRSPRPRCAAAHAGLRPATWAPACWYPQRPGWRRTRCRSPGRSAWPSPPGSPGWPAWPVSRAGTADAVVQPAVACSTRLRPSALAR